MSLIDSFLTDEYTIKRSTKGTYVKGRYQPGPFEVVKVWGSLQPTNARELKLPEEGNRLKQYWKLYSDEQVLVNSESTLADSDIIYIDGEAYRAMNRIQYKGTDLDYFMTIVWREPQQQDDGRGQV